MEKQRTPLAIGIKKINSLAMDDKTIRQCVNILTELLPNEREAFEKVSVDMVNIAIDNLGNPNASMANEFENYFNQTFTQS